MHVRVHEQYIVEMDKGRAARARPENRSQTGRIYLSFSELIIQSIFKSFRKFLIISLILLTFVLHFIQNILNFFKNSEFFLKAILKFCKSNLNTYYYNFEVFINPAKEFEIN